MLQRLLYLFILSSLLSGCGTSIPTPLDAFKPLTEKDEIKISRQFRRDAKRMFKLVNQPEVQQYVDQVGRNILSVMGPQPFEYKFYVVEDPQLNAFAVPGGSIYINTGIIENAKSTDELASVIGHEIIHVKGRHIARMSGPDLASMIGMLGMLLGAAGGNAGAAGMVGQAIATQSRISFTRRIEQEADTLGVKYMAEAGYDPRGALGFFKTIAMERVLNPVNVPPYLLTHPLTDERIASVNIVIRALDLRGISPRRPDPLKRVQAILRLEQQQANPGNDWVRKLFVPHFQERGEVAHLRGLEYFYQGAWAQALESYEQARAISPDSPGLDRDLGRLYTQIGEYGLAHQAFERSFSREPNMPVTYLYLAELFERESQFREAAFAYRRALQLSPLWPEPARRLGEVYNKMDRLGDAYYYLGRSHQLADEDEKAIDDLERAVQIFGPYSPRGQVIYDELEAIKARI